MRLVLYSVATAGLMLLSSCVRETAPSSAASPAAASGGASTNAAKPGHGLIVTPEQGLEGKVAWVNSDLRFVVVTFPTGPTPALDQRMFIYRRGLKVGEVKITGPQRGDSIVGDILAGEAGTGDSVRDK